MNRNYDREAVWRKTFGYASQDADFAGRVTYKSNFEVDHILPISRGGTNNISNLQACHPDTNAEKSDNFPTFVANNRRFKVVRRYDGSYKVDPA